MTGVGIVEGLTHNLEGEACSGLVFKLVVVVEEGRGVEAGTVEDPKAGMQGNGWCFDVLVDSRRIAGRWLAAKADEFDEPVKGLLAEAAEHYAAIEEVCMVGIDCPWKLALPPEKYDEWTSELRKKQIERLEKVRELDRKAVEAVAKALESMT